MVNNKSLDELKEQISECFVIARMEGELTRFKDGISDANDVIDLLSEWLPKHLDGLREEIAKLINSDCADCTFVSYGCSGDPCKRELHTADLIIAKIKEIIK